MSDPRTQLVGAGYDAMTETWEEWKDQIEDDPRSQWCDELVTRLPEGTHVVELGCGGGTPETALLGERFRLTGVDLSHEQLRRARRRVPQARFVQADFTELDFEPGSVGAVAAFYSFNHVPRDLLPALLARIHRWLGPDGLFLATLGTGDTEGWTGDWLGVPMFFSSFPPEVNTRLLDEAGFELLRNDVVTIREPEGEVAFQWILGRR